MSERTTGQTVEQVIRERLAQGLGGWRGGLETGLPTVAFVVTWTLTKDVRSSVIASGAVVALLVALRLAQRSSLRYALSSVLPTAIAAFLALRSGRAEDAFLGGLIWSAVFGALTLLSILVRYPMVGFLLAATDPEAAQDPFGWRKDSAVLAVCTRLTWVLVALYAIRLGIMVPLYLASNVAALGVAKIVLGWPLYIAAVVAMGWLLMRGRTPIEAP